MLEGMNKVPFPEGERDSGQDVEGGVPAVVRAGFPPTWGKVEVDAILLDPPPSGLGAIGRGHQIDCAAESDQFAGEGEAAKVTPPADQVVVEHEDAHMSGDYGGFRVHRKAPDPEGAMSDWKAGGRVSSIPS